MLFCFADRPNYFCYMLIITILNSLWNIFYKIYAIEKYICVSFPKSPLPRIVSGEETKGRSGAYLILSYCHSCPHFPIVSSPSYQPVLRSQCKVESNKCNRVVGECLFHCLAKHVSLTSACVVYMSPLTSVLWFKSCRLFDCFVVL